MKREGSSPSSSRMPLARAWRQIVDQGIDHDVADELDLLPGDAFPEQVFVGVLRGGQEQVGQGVGHQAVDLLRHGPVEAAQAGLDVGDPDAHLGADQGAGHRRVDVPDDDDPIRLLPLADGLEADQDAGRLDGMRSRSRRRG